MAEIPNTSVFSQTDASNNTGTVPTWAEGQAPSQVNDSARALQGAITREWNWRSFTLTSTGSANAYVLTYGVAPAAYYTGMEFAFTTNFGVTGSATVNVNGLGAKTIQKDVAGTLTNLSSGDMASGQYVKVSYNGSVLVWTNWQGPTAATFTGGTLTTATNMSSKDFREAKGAAVASAGTTDIWTPADGNFVHITGTTTITSFGTAPQAGAERVLVFDSALSITYNATTLKTPTGASLSMTAGSFAIVRADTTANMIVIYASSSSSGSPTKHTTVLTSGTTFTTNAAHKFATVTVIGGGANSGASGNAAGGAGGGGAGGVAIKTYVLTPSTGYTYAVGAAGSSSTFTDGTTLITGSGGTAGAATANSLVTSAGGAGGAATNGDINIAGGKGGSGAGVSAGLLISGAGGSNIFGAGGTSVAGGGGTAGNPGTGYGAGGGGPIGGSGAAGAGQPGAVIIEEWY